MTAPTPLHTGGCQCGAVRFALYAEPKPATICHCRMCQKAFGAFFGPLAAIPSEDMAWTRGAPAIFASSDKAERGFCANCGTPLTFAYVGSGMIDLALGTFDEPSRIPLGDQLAVEFAIPSFFELATRPRRAPDPEAELAEIAASNHQHPDYDTDNWAPDPVRAFNI